MPVWSLPDGQVSVQRVLQYPVCLIVVSADYALLVGPSSGLSTQELTGTRLGARHHAPAGRRPRRSSAARSSELTDQAVPLADTDLDASDPRGDRRRPRRPGPPAGRRSPRSRRRSRRCSPSTTRARLVNAIVEYVEGDPEVQRVGQVCDKFAITERTLQRLTARRIGLSPKWLIQRRRLHEAAERLRDTSSGPTSPASPPTSATPTRPTSAATGARSPGVTPGEFAAEPRERR